MDKSLIVVIDDFTDRVFEFDNVVLFDYGSYHQTTYYDNYYNVNTLELTGYGTYDTTYLDSSTIDYDFHLVTPDAQQSTYTFNNLPFVTSSSYLADFDLLNSFSFTDVFGLPATADTYGIYLWEDQTDESSVGHGDWVVDTIYGNLEDPDRTAILCIDVDTLNGVDSHLDRLFALDYYNSLLSGSLVTKFESIIYEFFTIFDQDFNPDYSSDDYVLAGASISIAGAPASFTEGIAIQTFSEYGAPIFQSAPNVNKGYYDWGDNFSDVINVGAWNVDLSGNLMVSSQSTLDTVDIVADGVVYRDDWGIKFGTSFATPAVAASYLNVLNSFIINMNLEGGSIDDESDTSGSTFDYSEFVAALVDYISTDVYVDFSDNRINDALVIPVLSDSVERNGSDPRAFPSVGIDGFRAHNTSLEVNQDAVFSNALLTSGQHEVGTTLFASVEFSDGNGTENAELEYHWYQRDGDVWNILSSEGSEYTIQASDVGFQIWFDVSFVDDEGYYEHSNAYGFPDQFVVEAVENRLPSGSVSIEGVFVEGNTLTAVNTISDPDGIGEISYQWNRNEEPIPQAVGSSYTLSADDVGTEISVTASYIDGLGASESISSVPIQITSVAIDATGPSITHFSVVDNTLTSSDDITVLVEVTDPSGLRDLAVRFNHEGGSAGTDFWVQAYDFVLNDDGFYEITVPVSLGGEKLEGRYDLTLISVRDNAEGSSNTTRLEDDSAFILGLDEQNKSVWITHEEAIDATGPSITHFSVVDNTLTSSDDITVLVEVTDPSGLRDLAVRFNHEGGSAGTDFWVQAYDFVLNDDGFYEITVPVSLGGEKLEGRYDLTLISVRDNAEGSSNTTRLEDDSAFILGLDEQNKSVWITHEEAIDATGPSITHFSADQENSSPSIADGIHRLGAVAANFIANPIQLSQVAEVTDLDPDQSIGYGVRVSAGLGLWEFSDSSDFSGETLTLSAENQDYLLLSPDTYVRYRPDGETAEDAELRLFAWDGTQGEVETFAYSNSITGNGSSLSTGYKALKVSVSEPNWQNDTGFEPYAIRSNGGFEGVLSGDNYVYDDISFEVVSGPTQSKFLEFSLDENGRFFGRLEPSDSFTDSFSYRVMNSSGEFLSSPLVFNLEVLGVRVNTQNGTPENDLIYGDDSDDDIFAGPGSDSLFGEQGFDSLYGEEGDDLLFGGAGNDKLYTGLGADVVRAGSDNDEIYLTPDGVWGSGYRAVNVSGPEGIATYRTVKLEGKQRFADILDGGSGVDSLYLTENDDAFFLDDVFSDLNDSVEGYEGSTHARLIDINKVFAGSGDDVVDLTSTVVELSEDGLMISGGEGDDVIWASSGADTIYGGEGNDVIFGSSGSDLISGGSGSDIFEFTAKSGVTTITDYNFLEGDVIKIYRNQNELNRAEILHDENQISWLGSFGQVEIHFDTSITASTVLINYELI